MNIEEAPAPKSDQRTGSKTNKPGSAASGSGKITVSPATKVALTNKVQTHNEAMKSADKPTWARASYGALAAVYRRGSGAYSISHRPGTTRNQWAMARVNAHLYLLRNGKPANAAYTTDNDLLPSGHPKSTK